MRATGAYGRENVGTSNRKSGENPDRRKPKVSSATTIDGGLVGPKPMVKTAGDGQQVNIPALSYNFNGGTKRSMPGALLDLRYWCTEVFLRQIRGTALMQTSRIDEMFWFARINSCEEPSQKIFSGQDLRNRTVNRHRWVGGEHQGERVIPR